MDSENGSACGAVRPKLNMTSWTTPSRTILEQQEVSPRSTVESFKEDIKPQHGLESGVPSQADTGDTIIMAFNPQMSQSPTSPSGMSPEILEHLAKIVRAEVKAEMVEQQLRFSGSEVGSLDGTRDSVSNLTLSSSFPSPPSSVIDASVSSRISSPPSEENPTAHNTPSASSQSVNVTAPKHAPPSPQQNPVSPQHKPTVRWSDRPRPIIHGRSSDSSLDQSPVDQKWGRLFDEKGNATKRLGDVLRGISNYINSEMQPTGTIVLIPSKLAAFYNEHKVDEEPHRLHEIFSCQPTEYQRIQYLFEDLDCEYHLVPSEKRGRPTVPALTPYGFTKWFIVNIFAHPDVEAQRLNHIFAYLPINADGPAVDGRSERLPKELSRHLLPHTHDKNTRRLLEEAIRDFMDDIPSPLVSCTTIHAPRARPMTEKRYSESNICTKREEERRSSCSEEKRPTERGGQGKENINGRDRHSVPSRIRRNSSSGRPYNFSDLPPPPVGRNSISRQRSPLPLNRFTTSVPEIHHSGTSISPASNVHATPISPVNSATVMLYELSGGRDRPLGRQLSTSRDRRGEGDENEEKEKERDKRRRWRDESVRGPTWDDYLKGVGGSSGYSGFR